MLMRARTIFLLGAAAVAALYVAGEALARGGGGGGRGGGHAGMFSAWHGSALHGAHGMLAHGAHFPFKGQHSHGMHALGHNAHNMHHHMMAQGQWHSTPGFGMHGHAGSNMPGVWHKVSSFGSKRHDFRRNWQAGGGGWVYGGGDDLCLALGSCQGVWQIVPRVSSRSDVPRGPRRDWQVNGEL